MRNLTANELNRMRMTQNDAMPDTCDILKRSTSSNEWGNQDRAWVISQSNIPCGLEWDNQKAQSGEAVGEAEASVKRATLRLSTGQYTKISNADRVQIRELNNEMLATPLSFEVIEQPRIGDTGMLVRIRIVSDGS